ncbi:endonuclease/exonuclease/phosphatase family protein [Palleronia sp. LCG004]|uniref:endonuclease/exonuclease/phosphatase family protein n=1 Tax=Palleronia sp. LCG004 TaxID=3079304 RepID=UPI0029436638|nr:endonuclease/exonuclease/phosphatase family protein [Palleronia sp. LCG004]WOI57312.1 endonuclease/exonuclease/phosphatase family protein [Palleronia sp. LCG004]
MISIAYLSLVCIAAALFVVATALPLAPSHAWWVRAWDFPRVQLLILGVIVLFSAIFLAPVWKWAIVVPVLAGCIYQAIRILPYTPLMPTEMTLLDRDDSGSQVVILASNVEEPNDRYDDVAQQIREVDPDILFLMETDQTWYDQLEKGVTAYPNVVTELRNNYYGLIFATRLKVHAAHVTYLTPDDTPTLFAELETDAGNRFRFIGLHPRPPVPGNSTDDRDAQIIFSARFAREQDMPVIAVGDFNDAAWSDTSRRFKHVGGYVDPRVGRGMIASFDAKSRLLRAPIDQFYATPDIGVVEFRRGPAVGSDHFPMISRIELDPEKVRGANKAPSEMPQDELDELDRIVGEYRKTLDPDHLPDFK